MLNGPQQVKLQRMALRLVNAENMVAKLLGFLIDAGASNTIAWSNGELRELRKMYEEFEGRKKIGIRTRRSTGRTTVSKTENADSSSAGCATPEEQNADKGRTPQAD